jgi:hypothetical protein
MKPAKHGRGRIIGWMLAFGATLLSGCVAAGYSDGSAGVDVGYVGGFYEPYGYGYGGWGPGYRVGPPRGGYRGGSGFHGAPSIPRGPRGGGGGHRR